MLLLLLACNDGADTAALDTGTPSDTADTGDTAEPLVFVELPEGCTPGSGGTDPLTLTTQLSVTTDGGGGAFMELVDVDIVDDLAYSVGQGGLLVGEISSDGTLTQTHRDPGMDRYHRVEVGPEGVYLVHRDRGVEYRQLNNLNVFGQRFGGEGDEGLALVGDRLYVANRTAGTVVYDVSEPFSPQESGSGGGGSATWELVEGPDGYLYGADNVAGLTVIDVTSPDDPQLLASPDGAEALLEVAVEGDYAYGAGGGLGVVVYDLANPAEPVAVAWIETGGSAVSVAVANDVLWVADHEAISAWDVSDPVRPLPIAWEQVDQFSLAVDAWSGGAVVGDWGYFESWTLDKGESAPALDTPLSGLRAGVGVAETTLTNRGGGTLEILDAEADGAVVRISGGAEVAPGETATLRITYTGEAPTNVCLGTNDPDRPTVNLAISENGDEAPVGNVAPDFSLTSTTGETHRLSEQLGNPVLFTYFATW